MSTIRCAVDLETTGLAKGRDEIIEAAFILFDDTTYDPISKFVSFIRPLRGINAEAMAINGISEAMLINAPTPLQVRSAFLDWKENIIGEGKIELLGWNVCGFDRPFLDFFFTQEVSNELFSHRADDGMVLFRALRNAGVIKSEKASLDAACTYFNIPRNKAHRAYDDALASLILWKKMISILSKLKK